MAMFVPWIFYTVFFIISDYIYNCASNMACLTDLLVLTRQSLPS